MLDRIDGLLFNAPALFYYVTYGRALRRMKRLTVLGVDGLGRAAHARAGRAFPGASSASRAWPPAAPNPELVAELCRAHRPRAVALSDERAVDAVARALGHRARRS